MAQTSVTQIPDADDIYTFPASYAQRRLWFLDQLAPGNAAYNIVATLRLRGVPAVEALRRALEEVTARHESLRTTFTAPGGEPAQVVAARTAAPPLGDLVDPADLPEGEWVRWAAAEAATPFDLARGPLLRARLLRLDEREHILLLTMHHIVSDEWSMGVLLGELGALYSAFAQGLPSPLAELPVQYADYAEWQRGWLAGAELAGQVAYWRRILAGAPEELGLPTDRPRPREQSYRGAVHRFALPEAVGSGLGRLARAAGATPFMVLLAGFQMLLSRYSGQEDLVVGTPIAGRTRSELEGLIGFFVNTLALRADLSGDPSFRVLLGRVREAMLGAYAHQDLPFERLVEELAPRRDLSRNPLFQTMFVLQNASSWTARFHGLEIETILPTTGTAKFDLTLYMMETSHGLIGSFEYSTDLFDVGTIERIAGHYATLLESALADPDLPLSRLPFSSPFPRPGAHEADITAPRTDAHPMSDYPRDSSIHQIFERQVELTPDAVALVFGSRQLRYWECNEQANRLAHYLRAHGVGPEVVVGVCLERSLDLVISLLAILKAGGAYLPLDPRYPRQRLAYMLEDAKPALAITQDSLVSALPAIGIRFLSMNDVKKALSQQPSTNAETGPQPLNLAYVNYTSGSTGRPKGVSVVHRAVVRLVQQTNYMRFSPDDVFLQFSPISFDAATFEIWGPLLNGGRLVIFPPHLPALDELGQAIQHYGITTLWLTAGLFHEMVGAQLPRLRGVRYLLAGGDVLLATDVRQALMQLPGCTVIDGYGPTENTTFTTCYPMTDPSQVGKTVPIGRPISNTSVYVLNEVMEPVSDGVPGELYIGGAGLARGYLNQPERTAERFVPNPFGSQPGDRLYRSGDLVRRLPGGNLEFLGRLDRQIKLRGFRIEPGEIESVLAEHPLVRSAAVELREDRPDDKRLVAYLVAESQAGDVIAACRTFLRERLPDYMVPSAFVCLEALPLTPEGKLNRDALPVPTRERSTDEARSAAPETPLQRELTLLWEDLLGVRPIGIRDDFFDLGGHSLLAVKLMSAVERIHGRRLPLTSLFSEPTIEHMAATLVQEEQADRFSPLTPIQSGTSRHPLFFVHGDRLHNGMYCVRLARLLGSDQPFYVLHNGTDVPHSVEAMASYHMETIRAIQPTGPYLLGGYCAGGVVAFEIAGQLRKAGQAVGLVALVEAQRHDVLYPRLHRLITGIGAMIGVDAAERLDLSVQLRFYTSRWDYYAGKLRHLSRRSTSEQFNWLLRQVRRSLRGRTVPRAARFAREQGPSGVESREWRRAVHSLVRYSPDRYQGRIDLFWGGGEKGTHIDGLVTDWQEATHHWRGVAGDVRVHLVPGTHGNLITTHLPDLADQLRACIEDTTAP